MNTTLDLDDQLLAKAKARAAHERSSLTRLIEDGLRLRLRSARRPSPRRTPELAIYRGGGGLHAKLHPRSNRSVLDAADDGS